MKLTNPSELKRTIEKHGFSFSKSLGQNFLIDENVLQKIVDASGVDEKSGALEIGPGAGTLTRALAERAAKTVAIEVDTSLQPLLADTLQGLERVSVIWEDVLKVDLAALLREQFGEMPVAVVANLPYYITTPILMKFLEERQKVRSLTVMVQKEVADRMAASPGGKDYGALSVAVQYYTAPQTVCRAEPHCFMPQPKVASTVLHLAVREEPPVRLKEERLFFAVVKAAFGKRRKTLLNALSSDGVLGLDKSQLAQVLAREGFDEKIRGERLSIEEFARLANAVYEQRQELDSWCAE